MAIERFLRDPPGAEPGRARRSASSGPSSVGAAILPLPEFVRPRSARRDARGRGWLIHRALLLADVAGLSVAFTLAQLLFKPSSPPYIVSPGLEVLVFALTLPAWVVMAQLVGLYGRDGQRADHSTVDDVVGVFGVITVGVWLLSIVVSLTHEIHPTPVRMVAFWLMAIVFVLAGRATARALARRHPLFQQNTVIVGAGDVGQLIARKLQQHPEYGLRVVGFADVEPRGQRSDLTEFRRLGSPEELPELVERYNIDRVIIAYSMDSHEHLLDVIHRLKAVSVQIDLVPRLFEAVGPKVDMHTVEALPLLGLSPVRLSPSARFVKRSIDLVVGTSILLLVSPLFVYLAWRVKRDSPGPVFFRQTRLGLNMKEFTAYKFRTMYEDTDESAHRAYVQGSLSWRVPAGNGGVYKPDMGAAVTPFGRKLRRMSLDELPQFLNVLKGDMSLVGPRPCIPYETQHFASHHFERFLVPAGLTGLWQVTARANSSFGEALEMDVAYARSWSLGLDLRLLCKTPLAVVHQTTSTT
jgi:exopolysaccharide biosynthesis polyprenyl glycosylphosphotransferase